MENLIDISDKTTVSNTAYSTTPTYVYKAPYNRYARITEIAIGANSSMIENGKLQITIGGFTITAQASAKTEIGVISNLTISIPESAFIFLEPQAEIKINARVTSAPATAAIIQMQVTGNLLNDDEFKLVKNKFLVGKN